jgi:hypothetical protein
VKQVGYLTIGPRLLWLVETILFGRRARDRCRFTPSKTGRMPEVFDNWQQCAMLNNDCT